MRPTKSSCITLDYLEIYCHRNSLVVGCRTEEDELWVSELGPEPSELSQTEIQEILRECRIFELRKQNDEEEDELFESSSVVTRPEMEARLRGLLN